MSSDEGWFHLHLRIVETYATTFPALYTANPRRPLFKVIPPGDPPLQLWMNGHLIYIGQKESANKPLFI